MRTKCSWKKIVLCLPLTKRVTSKVSSGHSWTDRQDRQTDETNRKITESISLCYRVHHFGDHDYIALKVGIQNYTCIVLAFIVSIRL